MYTMYIYIYIYIYICVYIHIHIYTHTYTYNCIKAASCPEPRDPEGLCRLASAIAKFHKLLGVEADDAIRGLDCVRRLYYTVLYYTILYYTILYYTILGAFWRRARRSGRQSSSRCSRRCTRWQNTYVVLE